MGCFNCIAGKRWLCINLLLSNKSSAILMCVWHLVESCTLLEVIRLSENSYRMCMFYAMWLVQWCESKRGFCCLWKQLNLWWSKYVISRKKTLHLKTLLTTKGGLCPQGHFFSLPPVCHIAGCRIVYLPVLKRGWGVGRQHQMSLISPAVLALREIHF